MHYLAVVAPDGLCIFWDGPHPGSTPDCTIYEEAQLENIITDFGRAMRVEVAKPGGQPVFRDVYYMLYGDAGFTRGKTLATLTDAEALGAAVARSMTSGK